MPDAIPDDWDEQEEARALIEQWWSRFRAAEKVLTKSLGVQDVHLAATAMTDMRSILDFTSPKDLGSALLMAACGFEKTLATFALLAETDNSGGIFVESSPKYREAMEAAGYTFAQPEGDDCP